MHRFLANNRDELIARCKEKVARRPLRAATEQQLANGVPLFLEQLIRTLSAEDDNEIALGVAISGPAGGDALALSEIGVSATAHGKQLLHLGYTVDQVVHDYGDLCQAITDLAFERDAPFAVADFRTLNRCLDNAIADAVTEFAFQRDVEMSALQEAGEKQRMGFLVHELRNVLGTATLAVTALEVGKLTLSGATGAILKRSLAALGSLVTRATSEVMGSETSQQQQFSLADFIADAEEAARLDIGELASAFEVRPVDPTLGVLAHRDLLQAALANLLQNAFKYTRLHSTVILHAYAFGDQVFIDVEDHCGGLSPGAKDKMFLPFEPSQDYRAGLGLGLSIARRNVEADDGTLTVRNVPRSGCVFTIRLPRYAIT